MNHHLIYLYDSVKECPIFLQWLICWDFWEKHVLLTEYQSDIECANSHASHEDGEKADHDKEEPIANKIGAEGHGAELTENAGPALAFWSMMRDICRCLCCIELSFLFFIETVHIHFSYPREIVNFVKFAVTLSYI